eukprot:gene8446-5924_t
MSCQQARGSPTRELVCPPNARTILVGLTAVDPSPLSLPSSVASSMCCAAAAGTMIRRLSCSIYARPWTCRRMATSLSRPRCSAAPLFDVEDLLHEHVARGSQPSLRGPGFESLGAVEEDLVLGVSDAEVTNAPLPALFSTESPLPCVSHDITRHSDLMSAGVEEDFLDAPGPAPVEDDSAPAGDELDAFMGDEVEALLSRETPLEMMWLPSDRDPREEGPPGTSAPGATFDRCTVSAEMESLGERLPSRTSLGSSATNTAYGQFKDG